MNNYNYTPSHIANFFLEKKNHKITNLKLNKLVYISLGYSLSYLDEDIFPAEEVEAWKFGPVIPSLYHEFKVFGKKFINTKSAELEFEELDIQNAGDNDIDNSIKKYYPKIDKKHQDLHTIISAIQEIYQNETGIALMKLTHQEGTPWSISYSEGKQVIDKKLIKQYYDIFLK